MVRRRSEWPAIDDFVICTVTRVFAQGAFARLDEYGGKEGMIHISEVASGWIKNIRDYVREGQKAVCKVLAVDPKKGHIDLSMRRVKEKQRRWKAQQWKREQRAEKLLEVVANKLGKNLGVAYEEVGFELQDKFGDLYSALEAVATKGKVILAGLKADESWINAINEIAASTIEAPTVEVVGYINLSCPTPNGIEAIKSALIGARDFVENPDVDVDVRYVGSPRYRIKITAPSYRVAEGTLQKVAEVAIASIKKAGGKGEFHPAAKGE